MARMNVALQELGHAVSARGSGAAGRGARGEGTRGTSEGLGEGDRRGSGQRRAPGLENSWIWKGCGGFGNRREGGWAGGTGGLRGGGESLWDAGAAWCRG